MTTTAEQPELDDIALGFEKHGLNNIKVTRNGRELTSREVERSVRRFLDQHMADLLLDHLRRDGGIEADDVELSFYLQAWAVGPEVSKKDLARWGKAKRRRWWPNLCHRLVTWREWESHSNGTVEVRRGYWITDGMNQASDGRERTITKTIDDPSTDHRWHPHPEATWHVSLLD